MINLKARAWLLIHMNTNDNIFSNSSPTCEAHASVAWSLANWWELQHNGTIANLRLLNFCTCDELTRLPAFSREEAPRPTQRARTKSSAAIAVAAVSLGGRNHCSREIKNKRKIDEHRDIEPSLTVMFVEACCVPEIIEFILHAPADVSCA